MGLCIMQTANELHERYNRQTGIAFSSIYPGCIAESPLFREKRPWFRKYFPVFMKYITGGFVGETEAGSRLFQVITDPNHNTNPNPKPETNPHNFNPNPIPNPNPNPNPNP